jgi:hypothetical protein
VSLPELTVLPTTVGVVLGGEQALRLGVDIFGRLLGD